jgi:hypothetical protein
MYRFLNLFKSGTGVETFKFLIYVCNLHLRVQFFLSEIPSTELANIYFCGVHKLPFHFLKYTQVYEIMSCSHEIQAL